MTQLYDRQFPHQERASAPVSKTVKCRRAIKGSVTVEAALTLPLFLFAVLSLIYLLEIQAIHLTILHAAQGAAKCAAEDIAIVQILNPIKLKADLINLAGADRLERSIIQGGSSGVRCWRSWYEAGDGIIHMEVDYRVRLPFPGFTNTGMRCNQDFTVKAWTGYESRGTESSDDQIVYVTERGTVYHTNYQCRYLQLSIRFVPYSGVADLRNADGGRYHACRSCVNGGASAGVYITDYGDRYHTSLNCRGLKRTVHSVKKRECIGMSACGKCSDS